MKATVKFYEILTLLCVIASAVIIWMIYNQGGRVMDVGTVVTTARRDIIETNRRLDAIDKIMTNTVQQQMKYAEILNHVGGAHDTQIEKLDKIIELVNKK